MSKVIFKEENVYLDDLNLIILRNFVDMIKRFVLFLGWCTYCYGKDFWKVVAEAKRKKEQEE